MPDSARQEFALFSTADFDEEGTISDNIGDGNESQGRDSRYRSDFYFLGMELKIKYL